MLEHFRGFGQDANCGITICRPNQEFDATNRIRDHPIHRNMVFAIKNGEDSFGFEARSRDMSYSWVVERCNINQRDFRHLFPCELRVTEYSRLHRNY